MTDAIRDFVETIAEAARTGRVLRLHGGGTKDFFGNALCGDVLDTRGHAGIVSYEPTELVVTARCGTPLAELEAALAEQGQMLACEPPHFGAGATVGGMVAAGLSGPRRATAGAVRDFVLGARLLDSAGRQLRFGGEVMKNVAGYDVSRLLAGSLGTLGLILDVSLKVLPRPAAEATLRFALSEAEALATMNRWAGQALPVSATAWFEGALTVRLSGARAAVAAACARLGGESLAAADAEAFWRSLRQQTLGFFAGTTPLWRLSVPSAAPAVDGLGPTLIEWGGAQRWLRGDIPVERIRAAAAVAGGHATLFRGGDRAVGVFAPLAPPLAELNRRVRLALDEAGVFATGRL